MLRREYWLIVSMFWAVLKISLLSILKLSATMKRDQKVLVETSIAMNESFVSFSSVKSI